MLKTITFTELQSRIENHKLWLADNSKGAQLKLVNFDLSGKDLTNNNFSQAVFITCDFEAADLDNCNFTEATVKHCKLSDATLRFCDFTSIDSLYNNFNESDLFGSNFTDSDLTRSSFKNSTVNECNFTDSDLCGCDLSGCDLRDSNLFSANMFQANYDTDTQFPKGTKLLNGYHYKIFIHQGEKPSKLDSYQVGCKLFTAEEWLSKTNEDLIEMDGRSAMKFYPELVEIIKFFSKL